MSVNSIARYNNKELSVSLSTSGNLLVLDGLRSLDGHTSMSCYVSEVECLDNLSPFSAN